MSMPALSSDDFAMRPAHLLENPGDVLAKRLAEAVSIDMTFVSSNFKARGAALICQRAFLADVAHESPPAGLEGQYPILEAHRMSLHEMYLRQAPPITSLIC